MKKVSIIIPAYNPGELIAKTVRDLKNQTYENFEVLIIDDGSEKGNSDIMDRLADEDARVRVIHKENGGVSSARNKGIEEMTGEYCMFLDADDFFKPEAIETAVKIIEETESDCVMFGSDCETYDNGVLISSVPTTVKTDFSFTKEDIANGTEKVYKAKYLAAVWNKIYNAKMLKESDVRFDSRFTNFEDLLFSLKAIPLAKKIAVTGKTLYRYIKYDKNTASSRYHEGTDKMIINLVPEMREAFSAVGTEEKEIPNRCVPFYVFAVYSLCKQNKSNSKIAKDIKAFSENDTMKYVVNNAFNYSTKYYKLTFELARKKLYMAVLMLSKFRNSRR